MPDSPQSAIVSWLGCMAYDDALDLQMSICSLKRRRPVPDVLLLLEHSPTITLGRNGTWQNLLASREDLTARGIRLIETDRGGDITFHGPGQLVGYPIMQLDGPERDVRLFMRKLEESLLRLLARFGIAGHREEGYAGVWTDRGKIAAMGVHLSRWVTRHGFALNVRTDLSYFDWIIPCGMHGRRAASMSQFLKTPPELEEAGRYYAEEYAEVFSRRLIWMSRAGLREELARLAA